MSTNAAPSQGLPGGDPGAREPMESTTRETATHRHILIIGAGFAGLGAAIKLLEAGEHDFLVLEKADDVGGCWRDNTYPGCQCDVQSNVYSYSFAPNPRWSRLFPWQSEILDYMRGCADRYGVRPYIRFETAVEGAHWVEEEQRWRVETSRGTFTADFVIAGTGGLSAPSTPELPGLERFEGPTFHSARWRHDVDLKGKRVAVVGTGASAIQVVPSIQPEVAELHLFQRSAPWVFPRRDAPVGPVKQLLYRALPFTQRIARTWRFLWLESRVFPILMRPKLMERGEEMALAYMRSQVSDPELQRKLTPDYALGCKRMLLSDDYYPAVAAPNTELCTSGIREITAKGIVDQQGTLHEVDAIVFCTGFKMADHPATAIVHGRDGRTLAEHWEEGAKAYLGTTIAGFPNFFMMTGPNSGLGHNSIIYIIESQLTYIQGALATAREAGAKVMSVRREVVERYDERIQQKLSGTVWDSGCESWYLDHHGRNVAIWPGFARAFRKRTERFDPESYDFEPAPTRAVEAPARSRAESAAA